VYKILGMVSKRHSFERFPQILHTYYEEVSVRETERDRIFCRRYERKGETERERERERVRETLVGVKGIQL